MDRTLFYRRKICFGRAGMYLPKYLDFGRLEIMAMKKSKLCDSLFLYPFKDVDSCLIWGLGSLDVLHTSMEVLK